MNRYIRSPLNYPGNKYKLLPYLIPLFPTNSNIFVDLFCGSCNIGINISATKILCNDRTYQLIDIFNCFKTTELNTTLNHIHNRIGEYHLSLTNADGYDKFRTYYNQTRQPLDLFILLCYAFNHQLSLNSKGEFNESFGRNRSRYNPTTERNLIDFIKAIHSKNIEFISNDFNGVDLSYLTESDFVYCDPPYLCSDGIVNRRANGFSGWNIHQQETLLSLLDWLNNRKVKFGLSEVLVHKGIENKLLKDWCGKYKTHYIENNYKNCSYQSKHRTDTTIEIYITNYDQQPTFKQNQIFHREY